MQPARAAAGGGQPEEREGTNEPKMSDEDNRPESSDEERGEEEAPKVTKPVAKHPLQNAWTMWYI